MTAGRSGAVLRRAPFPLAPVLALGTTQAIGYGTLYYAFAVLSEPMAQSTGLSLTAVYGLFSLALTISGLVAPAAGRMMDRVNPALVMAAGSALAAILLAGWALAPTTAGFAVFLVAAEIASVLVLYEAAFVTAAHIAEPGTARRFITGITFIGGFASTVFWPLTQWLLTFDGWPFALLVYAALHALVCLPLHLWLARLAPPPPDTAQAMPEQEESVPVQRGIADPGRRRLLLVLLLGGFSANAFVIAAVHLHLIGMLSAVGLGAAAVWVGAWIGPSQVAARVLEFVTAGRTSVHVPSLVSAAALPVALLILLAGAPAIVYAVAFAILFGIGQGLAYIVRGVLPLEIFGRKGYGALMGRINAARLYVSAAAPFVTAAIIDTAGVTAALWAIAAVAFLSLALMGAVAAMTYGRT